MSSFHFTKDSPDEQLYSDIGSLNNYELAVLNELAGIIFGFLTLQNQVAQLNSASLLLLLLLLDCEVKETVKTSK